MTLEDEIAALIAEAAPLRCLHEDDPAAARLPALVSDINALRALQDKSPFLRVIEPPQPDPEAPRSDPMTDPLPRRPGRPRKAA